MKIYKVDSGYVVSINGSWIAGCFASEEAAKEAVNFTDAELQKLQDVKKSQPITLKDLKKMKRYLLHPVMSIHMTVKQLIQRMMSEGIPEDHAKKISSHSGSIEELKMRIRVYLEEINAENINNKIRRICKR